MGPLVWYYGYIVAVTAIAQRAVVQVVDITDSLREVLAVQIHFGIGSPLPFPPQLPYAFRFDTLVMPVTLPASACDPSCQCLCPHRQSWEDFVGGWEAVEPQGISALRRYAR